MNTMILTAFLILTLSLGMGAANAAPASQAAAQTSGDPPAGNQYNWTAGGAGWG